MQNKEAKRPAYRNSLSTLRSINDAEEQRTVDLVKLFKVYDTCMKDISAELESPHLSKIDKADALIASIAPHCWFTTPATLIRQERVGP